MCICVYVFSAFTLAHAQHTYSISHPQSQTNEEEIIDDNVLKTSWYTECSASESVSSNKKVFRNECRKKNPNE